MSILNLTIGQAIELYRAIGQRAAGIDAHFHDLTRHEFATRVVRQGKSLYVVQRALGRESPVMTQRYSHLSDRDLQDAVRGI